jgi:hypothetical protein
MPFQRPKASRALGKEERFGLLQSYYNHYREAARREPETLNRKIPRQAFDDLLDRIGSLLLEIASSSAAEHGSVRNFLTENALPKPLIGLLPDDFRVYCLALNALKQWLAAEQAATDKYLLGGKARQECRAAAVSCMVTGETLDPAEVELHHPIRDGRPPIPLSKKAHKRLEGQARSPGEDGVREKVLPIRRRMNQSWLNLRRGCLDLLGKRAGHSTPNVGASSKTFARKVSQETGMDMEQILAWLDANGL